MAEQEPQERGGESQLAFFGEELRREREIRGISLKEIADATKISRRFLEAIERNDHKTLPAPVFTRGFVREYARYVGLNAEDMVNRYNFAAATDDRIEKPPQIEKYPQTPVRDITPKPPPKRGLPSVLSDVNRNVIAILFLIAALSAVAWWAVQQRRPEIDGTLSPSDIPIVSATAPVSIPQPADAEPQQNDATLRLIVEALDDSWVTLEADGKTVLNAEMARGEQRTFEAEQTFRFRTIGNAAGLKLTFGGVPVPPLGQTGEVIKNRLFDREVLSDLRAETGSEPVQTES